MVQNINGHYLSTYPIVTPVLITPLYVIPYLILKIFNYPMNMLDPEFQLVVAVMEKISASIIASLSCMFVFLILNRLVIKKIAVLTTLIYAFGSSTWSVSSQELWQHGLAELLLAMLIYFVILNETRYSNKTVSVLGALLALFIFNRPADGFLVLPILLYIIIFYKEKIIYFAVPLFIISLPFIFYNFYYFKTIFGGYSSMISYLGLNYTLLSNLLGLLLSPSRGLLVYTPILILSIPGYLLARDICSKKIKFLLLIYGPIIIIQIMFYSSFAIWWAGWSYGPRFLTGMLPILFIFIGLYLNQYLLIEGFDRKILILILLLSIWSIFVQVVGAFFYPNGWWNGIPTNIDAHPERVWDWSDSQIIRTFLAGPAVHNPWDSWERVANYFHRI